MNHIGLVLGLEMSRLARSNKDWHHLLEVCAVFGTLLADQDGVYDPRDSNNRLLLGLKGTMSEFELVTMRNRLERGKLNKAERGELFIGVPASYVKLPNGAVTQDPDEQVRAVVALIFDKFEELGSIYAVFHYLVRNDIRLGGRVRCGPQRGQVEWRRPSLPTLWQMLRHPIYAGAYAFGRRPLDPKRRGPGCRAAKRWLPMEEWKVLKRDVLPAYISWDRYLANFQRLGQNRLGPESMGSARRGTALLSGLIVCGTCGLRMQTSYRRIGLPFYSCTRHLTRGIEQTCYGLKAAVVDEVVAQQVLRALEPAALEPPTQLSPRSSSARLPARVSVSPWTQFLSRPCPSQQHWCCWAWARSASWWPAASAAAPNVSVQLPGRQERQTTADQRPTGPNLGSFQLGRRLWCPTAS
jgi:hypothetical protein